MTSTPIGNETHPGKILRIHGQSQVSIEALTQFLADLEFAYNCAYVFDSLGTQSKALHQRTLGQPSTPMGNSLWQTWWPPTPEKVAALVPDDQKLQLHSVELCTMGCWDFSGQKTALDILHQYLNARYNPVNNGTQPISFAIKQSEIETRLRNISQVQDCLENLERLSASSDDQTCLINFLLQRPLKKLDSAQDRQLIWTTERLEATTDQNVPDLTLSRSTTPSPAKTYSPIVFEPNELITIDPKGVVQIRKRLDLDYGIESLPGGIPLELALIPAGTFTMGSPPDEFERSDAEGPQHQVNLFEFYLGKYEITQAQWQAVMGSNLAQDLGENRPVDNVSWNDAIEFCQKLSRQTGKNYRLPSEAEWEYACRAGTSTPFYFGETIAPELANYNAKYGYDAGPEGEFLGKTTEVGIYPPNAFGLYDMHGNVWEWCQDTWHPNYDGAPSDGSAWEIDGSHERVLRGGSWYYFPRLCRSVYRFWWVPDERFKSFGFRVVCDL